MTRPVAASSRRRSQLGVKTFAIHKGLPISGFSVAHNLPDDIGPVAKDYPDCNFIVYHSSICAGQMGYGLHLHADGRAVRDGQHWSAAMR